MTVLLWQLNGWNSSCFVFNPNISSVLSKINTDWVLKCSLADDTALYLPQLYKGYLKVNVGG